MNFRLSKLAQYTQNYAVGTAIREAEAYDGPSLIIAYAPCINYGLKAGMGKSQAEEAKTVERLLLTPLALQPNARGRGQEPILIGQQRAAVG